MNTITVSCCIIATLFLVLSSGVAEEIELTPRVHGGEQAIEGKFPFIVSIWGSGNRYQAKHACGGSIINNKWVLTAAHCFIDGRYRPSDLIILAGAHDLTTNPGHKYEIEMLIGHEEYYKYFTKIYNDIGLIKIKEEFDFTKPTMQPVQLYSENIESNVEVTAIGWGHYDYTKKSSSHLKELNMTSISTAHCKRKHANIVDQLCAISERTTGVCHGDSGGPLLIKNTNKQVGIASFLIGNYCGSQFPDAFTNVPLYKKWIESTINQN